MCARISCPRSIAASLMVVYSTGAGVVPKGSRIHRKASFPTIVMHAICVFEWMRQYAVLRYVFLSRSILKAIWCTWLQSYVVSWEGIIRRNMAGGCLSAIGFSQIFLKVRVNSSRGWHVFYYSVLLSSLLIIVMLPQAGRLPLFWCDVLSQL